MALGASRLRLVAHALSETLTLAAVSGVLGSLTGVALIGLRCNHRPYEFPGSRRRAWRMCSTAAC